MDNSTFIQQSKSVDPQPVVIPPAPEGPFTEKTVRDMFCLINLDGVGYKTIAEELNKVAHNFYSKK